MGAQSLKREPVGLAFVREGAHGFLGALLKALFTAPLKVGNVSADLVET